MSVLDKFTVVDLIKSRSASVATITGNILKFKMGKKISRAGILPADLFYF